MTTNERLVLAAAGLLAIAGLAGCGDDPAVSGESDPDQVLAEAFGGDGEPVESGVFELGVAAESSGGEQPGSVDISLAGPFDTNGDSELPDFDFDLTAEVAIPGGEQSYAYGAAATEGKAWINFEGVEFELDEATYEQLAGGFEASAAAGEEGEGATLSGLGLDPVSWLTEVTNEGSADVEGTETVHVSGRADLEAMFTDISDFAGSQPIPAGELPSAEEIAEITEVVEAAAVDIYTGADDGILRRFTIALELSNPDDPASAVAIDVDLTLSELNEEQEVAAPEDARPIAELLARLGGLGGFDDSGGLGGLAPGLPVPG